MAPHEPALSILGLAGPSNAAGHGEVMTRNLMVLVLSGTCGSGKSTIATLLAARPGWCRVREDDIWPRHFGKERGAFGTAEHRYKRGVVHSEVLERVQAARRDGLNVVVDATIHEAPPEALNEYRAMFAEVQIEWKLVVLHPRLEVAMRRDAGRGRDSLGASHVSTLHAKFTGRVIPPGYFLDTSEESPEDTLKRVLARLDSQEPCATVGAPWLASAPPPDHGPSG